MKTTISNERGKVTQRNEAEPENRGRADNPPFKNRNPGGGGTRERIPAKGNDITHEDDLLQTDIEDEADNALDDQARSDE